LYRALPTQTADGIDPKRYATSEKIIKSILIQIILRIYSNKLVPKLIQI
jgi:hypothetical protein